MTCHSPTRFQTHVSDHKYALVLLYFIFFFLHLHLLLILLLPFSVKLFPFSVKLFLLLHFLLFILLFPFLLLVILRLLLLPPPPPPPFLPLRMHTSNYFDILISVNPVTDFTGITDFIPMTELDESQRGPVTFPVVRVKSTWIKQVYWLSVR